MVLLRLPIARKCHLRFGSWGLRVFRTVFDFRSERLLCRCYLPAQDRVRLLHVISSARIAILDLVLGIILSNKRHPDYVSSCCDSALSRELCSNHWAHLHLDLPKRIERCEEDGLSSFLALFSSCNESVLKDGLDAERTTTVKHKLCPMTMNINVRHQFRCNCYSTRVSLNCSKVPTDFSNPRNTRTSFCCSLHG